MADITMCLNTLCPNAEGCRRIQAKPSDFQSVQMFEYHVGVNGVECDYYWPIYEIKSTTQKAAS